MLNVILVGFRAGGFFWSLKNLHGSLKTEKLQAIFDRNKPQLWSVSGIGFTKKTGSEYGSGFTENDPHHWRLLNIFFVIGNLQQMRCKPLRLQLQVQKAFKTSSAVWTYSVKKCFIVNYFICLTLDTGYVLGSWNILKYFFHPEFCYLSTGIIVFDTWKRFNIFKIKNCTYFFISHISEPYKKNSAFFLRFVRLLEKIDIQSLCKMGENLMTVV